MAAKLRATTASPRFAYVFSTKPLIRVMASSGGRMPASWKKQGCMTVLIRLPMPDLVGDGERIDHPEVDLLVDQLPLDATRQVVPDLVRPVRGVEQERRPVPGGLEDLRLAEQPELVAGDEVGLLDEVGGADGLGPEAQVRHGDRARLLGVVHEVALGEQVGALADDLDRCLVRADGAVRAESEEHRLDLAGRTRVPDSRRRWAG